MSSRLPLLIVLAGMSTASTCDSNVGDGTSRTRETVRTSQRADGGEGTGLARHASISPDGRYVVFQSAAADLVEPDENGYEDVFLKDRLTGELRNVTRVAPTLLLPSNVSSNTVLADAGSACVSNDARVAFLSRGYFDGFIVYPPQPGPTVSIFWIDPKSDGFEEAISQILLAWPNRDCSSLSMSDDGRFLAFISGASNIGTSNGSFIPQVYVIDLLLSKKVPPRLVSRGAAGAAANAACTDARISGDGRHVVFLSGATNLGASAAQPHVFLGSTTEDVAAQKITVVPGTATSAAGQFAFPTVSRDGRYVAFYTKGSDLVPGTSPNSVWIVRVDRVSGSAENVAWQAWREDAFPSGHPISMGEDGSIAYRSLGAIPQIYVQKSDPEGAIWASVSSRGELSQQDNQFPRLSSDGRWLVWQSAASNLVQGDRNGGSDIFVHGPLR